ncbi:DUF4279 domain-containing protein [Oligoflexus tunisiensis]|uniref:DUF4279 domain-containing protein n=1 Tax=Oligoflexus tunisiensis TaxID=708132 RepID=UPI00114C859E|nr:DUF4279 domain-containing protein [Oligoflexus tunisiensis]
MDESVNSTDALECRVKLLIYPGDLDPEKVTEILGITPTEIFKKGQISGPNSLGRVRINKNNCWFLISDEVLKSNMLVEHMDWMLDKLSLAKSGLDVLKTVPGVSISFRCTWWTKDGGWFTFTANQLKKIADLGLDLEFEIAAYPDDKDSNDQSL